MITRGGVVPGGSERRNVWQIAVGTMEGHNELMSAIQRRLQPTEEGIAEARQSFRGQVQGS